MLCTDGDYAWDLDLTEDGDIKVGSNLAQDVKIAVSWILGEWRLGPEIGMPWYEEIWVKNPNIDLIRQEIVGTILGVEGVTDASAELLEFDPSARIARFQYTATTDDESYSGEAIING